MIAVSIGSVIAVLLVLAADTAFGWHMDIPVGKSRFYPRGDDSDGLGWTAKDERGLKKFSDHYSYRHRKVVGDEAVFDAIYTFDKLYRRVVTGQPDHEVERFIVFFGGSQTFGEGLNDSETIPALIQESTPSYRVYNYAYRGYGPHQMLKKLETYKLRNELNEDRGIAFFQYFTFHIPRVLGTMNYISWAGGSAPYYQLSSKGKLEYNGSFANGRFFKTFLYWVLGKSSILKYFDVDSPAKLVKKHYDLVCSTLAKSRDVFLDQFPDSRFIVVIGITSDKEDSFIERCLDTNSIESVDMRDQYTGNAGLQFKYDGHLTPGATRLTARKLLPLL